MKHEHEKLNEFNLADAVLLLEAPHRETPDVTDVARPPFVFGLLLLPVVAFGSAIVTVVT